MSFKYFGIHNIIIVMLKKNKDSQFDLNKVLLFNELNVSIYKQ